MKKTDIIVCFALAILSAILSVVITRAIFGEPERATATIEEVDEISAEVIRPDPLIFNRYAIDPTVEVCIGDIGEIPEECYGQFEVVDPSCNPDVDPNCAPDEEN